MNNHWITIRFKLDDYFASEKINSNDSPLHLMIAHEVCSPLLDKHKSDIVLWRFHRLYIEEGESAQNSFRFKVYGDKALKQNFLAELKKDPLVKDLRKLNLLRRLEIDFSDGPRIEDDYDVRYSLMIKRIWPYYINGVSIAWLKAIECHCRYPNLMKADFWTRLDHYAKVAELIEEDWVLWARPAIFHHANVLFGYKFVDNLFGEGRVIEKKERRFVPRLFGLKRYRYKKNKKPVNLLINY